jgi:UDP-glucose 4-epimerase
MVKSLVTGGAGFIGSNLVDQLVKKKHKVIVLDNFSTGRRSNLSHQTKKNVKIIKVDISSNKNLDKYFNDVDYVFHLAGIADIVPSIENPNKYFKSNVVGTLNVVQAAKKANIKKFIYAASASCYGTPRKFPTNENEKIRTMYPYSFAKWQAEELVMHWVKIYNFPAISLRFFNTYGPRSRTSGAYGAVFGVFLAQKLANKPLTIVGNGKQTRDFIHVKDLVRVVIKAALSRKVGKIYNVGSGKEETVNKIAKLIGGKKIHIPKRPGEPDRSLADISKIKQDFNWRPKIKIEEGVKDLISKIDCWKKAPIWTPKSIKKATKIWFKLLKKK